MKKQISYLVLLIAVLPFIVCNKEKQVQNCNWCSVGYINPNNPYEFVVNDSISIIEEECYGDYIYSLHIKGVKIYIEPSIAWQSTYNNMYDIIISIQDRYEDYLREHSIGVFYSSNYNWCN